MKIAFCKGTAKPLKSILMSRRQNRSHTSVQCNGLAIMSVSQHTPTRSVWIDHPRAVMQVIHGTFHTRKSSANRQNILNAIIEQLEWMMHLCHWKFEVLEILRRIASLLTLMRSPSETYLPGLEGSLQAVLDIGSSPAASLPAFRSTSSCQRHSWLHFGLASLPHHLLQGKCSSMSKSLPARVLSLTPEMALGQYINNLGHNSNLLIHF